MNQLVVEPKENHKEKIDELEYWQRRFAATEESLEIIQANITRLIKEIDQE